MFYFPVIAVFLSVSILVYFDVPVQSQVEVYSWVFPLALVVSAALLCIFKLKGLLGKFQTYLWLAYLNFFTALWLMLLALAVTRAWDHNVTLGIMSPKPTIVELIAVPSVCVLFHACLAGIRFAIRAFLVTGFIVAYVLYIYPGYAEIGASALREAQLGGGLPVTYTVSEGRTTTQEPESGCLVLATSSYVYISRLDHDKCLPLTRFVFTASENKARSVRVFARATTQLYRGVGQSVVTEIR
jgi:hypothetical protein